MRFGNHMHFLIINRVQINCVKIKSLVPWKIHFQDSYINRINEGGGGGGGMH